MNRWLELIHIYRGGWVLVVVLLLALTFVSPIVRRYWWPHLALATWMIAEILVYLPTVYLASDCMLGDIEVCLQLGAWEGTLLAIARVNGAFALLGLPLLGWVLVRARQEHAARLGALDDASAALESADLPSTNAALEQLGERLGIRRPKDRRDPGGGDGAGGGGGLRQHPAGQANGC